MERKKTAHTEVQAARAHRRHYHSPRLTECGSVGDLTQTGSNNIEYSDDPSYNLTYMSSPI
jgi:hypothetical protein